MSKDAIKLMTINDFYPVLYPNHKYYKKEALEDLNQSLKGLLLPYDDSLAFNKLLPKGVSINEENSQMNNWEEVIRYYRSTNISEEYTMKMAFLDMLTNAGQPDRQITYSPSIVNRIDRSIDIIHDSNTAPMFLYAAALRLIQMNDLLNRIDERLGVDPMELETSKQIVNSEKD